MILLIYIMAGMVAHAANKTWVGGTGTTLNWTVGSNWSEGTAPVAGDDIVFNTSGTIIFSVLPESVSYNSLTISRGDVTLAGPSAMYFTLGGKTGPDFTVAAGASLTIGSNANIIMGEGAYSSIAGFLTINDPQSYTAGGPSAVTNISGTLTNYGTYDATTTTAVTNVTGLFINYGTLSNAIASRLAFSDSGTYQHAQNGGTLPIAVWAVTANCNITGITDAYPNIPVNTQPFGNFTWNCQSQGSSIDLGGQLTTINGNFNVLSTNSGILQLGRNTSGNLLVKGNFTQAGGSFGIAPVNSLRSRTMTVEGDFTFESGSFFVSPAWGIGNLNVGGNLVSSGAFNFSFNAEFPGTATVNVAGNCLVTGGTFSLSNCGLPGTLYVGGDLSYMAGSNITETSSGSGTIVFNGNRTQTFTSGGTLSNTINFTVNSGSTLQMGTGATPSVISGSIGSFTLSPGASLGVTSPEGIAITGATGNIQVTGTRTFNEGAGYIYNGTSAQVTGTGLTQSTPVNVTIDNSAGVTLSAATTISGLLSMTNGTLDMNSYDLTAGSLTGSSDITASSGTPVLAAGSDGTDPAAYSGIVSNGTSTSVALTKSGAGTMILSNSNTYTGTTTISGGVLELESAMAIDDGSNVVLSGGALLTGATTGYSTTAGTLDLEGNSEIRLGTGNHTLSFDASNSLEWGSGNALLIKGWKGTILTSGTEGKIFAGTDITGLTDTQLDLITFYGYAPGAGLLSSGEIVPLKEPEITIATTDPAIAAGNITQNSVNNVIYMFSNAVSAGNVVMTGLQFTTAGTYVSGDISNFKAWYSDDNAFDSSSDVLLSSLTTSLGTGIHTFLGWGQLISNGTTGYIFITADFPCTSTAGANISVNAITASDVAFISGAKTITAYAGGVQTIQYASPENVTTFSASVADVQSVLTWDEPVGCYDEIMIVGKAGSPASGTPSGDGSSYTANLAYGTPGTAFGGGYVLYKGSVSSQTVTALTAEITYYYTFFSRRGTLWSSGATTSSKTIAISSLDFQSAGDGNWGDINTWQVSYDNGLSWNAATSTPSSINDQITIATGHTVTVASNITVDQVIVNGQVSVPMGVTLTINNGIGAVDFNVNGTLYNAGTLTTSGSLAFNGNSIYQHDRDGGSLPSATWAATSNCNITGVTETMPLNTSFSQAFGSFKWDCAFQAADISLFGFLQTIRGNLTIANSGNSYLVLGGISTGDLTIDGNYLQTGGSFALTWGEIARIMTVKGDFSLNDGTFSLSYNGGLGGNIMGTLQVAGNFSQTGGLITETSTSSPGGKIIFNGTGLEQTYTSGGMITNTVDITVNNGAYLRMSDGNTIISSGGRFTLSAGGALGITSENGITAQGTAAGNIQTTDRTFSTGGYYIYIGTVNQAVGSGLPSTVGGLAINNTGVSGNNIVSLNSAKTITDNLSVSNGLISLPAGTVSSASALTLAGAGAPGGSWGSTASSAVNKSDLYFLSYATGIVNVLSSSASPGTWIGTTSTGWNTPSNWFGSVVPASGTSVVIPAYAANQPFISDAPAASCGNLAITFGASLTINAGQALTVNGNLVNIGSLTINSDAVDNNGSLIVTGASEGIVTYNRYMAVGTLVHYISSPVNLTTVPAGEFYAWDEVTGDWAASTTEMPESGTGYSTTATGGSVSFTGNLAASFITIEASSPYSDVIQGGVSGEYNNREFAPGRDTVDNWGGGGWNLFGNPYTSALNAGAANGFIDLNISQFDPNYTAIYLYDGSSYGYIGYPTGWNLVNPGQPSQTHLQVGQGFFVRAMNNSSAFTFAGSMQVHKTTMAYTKAETAWPGIQLKVTQGVNEESTLVVFNDGMADGLDKGYDIGQLAVYPDVDIYTSLVLNDNGVRYIQQALAIPDNNDKIIDVGIDSENGGEVTFSATTVVPEGYSFILEDYTAGVFTDMTTDTYTVTLPANTYGTGRFFLHTKYDPQTGIDPVDPDQTDVRIWASQRKVIIKGALSQKAIAEVYDLQGHKVCNIRLTGATINTIDLSSSPDGVYIVVVVDGDRIYRQKVIVL